MIRQSGAIIPAAELMIHHGQRVPHCPTSPVRKSPQIAEFGILPPDPETAQSWRTGSFDLGNTQQRFRGRVETYLSPANARPLNIIGYAAVQLANRHEQFDTALVAQAQAAAMDVLLSSGVDTLDNATK